jgi:histidyl-tRNA synthetase
MFISIILDLATIDSEKEITKILKEYGLKKIHTNVFESYEFLSKKLGNLKRDISNFIDMDDKLRIYQYPLDKVLKISYVENGKWKRLSIK